MNTQKFSLIIAGLIWTLVGVRILMRALDWLSPYFNPPSPAIAFVLLSIIVGYFKAKKVLSKSVERGIRNSANLDGGWKNYFFGWLKLYGVKGVVIVLLMIGLGFVLRALKAAGFDSFNIFGFIYLAVAFALIGASLRYYQAAFKERA